ncbi:40S ribosomal protein S13 [Tanacetum coccineum]
MEWLFQLNDLNLRNVTEPKSNGYSNCKCLFTFVVHDNICKFVKNGLAPSEISVILYDSHGIAQVNSLTGSKILRILKSHGLATEMPEDLYHLIKKVVAIRKLYNVFTAMIVSPSEGLPP